MNRIAKLEIPIRVYMGELEEIINELKRLQTYKLFEGDDMVLIDCDEVVKIFADHLRAEVLSNSTIGTSAQMEMPPYVAEIEREYRKWVNVPHINKPLAKALYEVWKKHDREDVNRNG